jgi:hypothetical protein
MVICLGLSEFVSISKELVNVTGDIPLFMRVYASPLKTQFDISSEHEKTAKLSEMLIEWRFFFVYDNASNNA